jgi:hypothetical protein
MPVYPTSSFVNSRAAFDAAVSALSAEDALDLDHGEVERRAKTRGDEFIRSLIQDHLDLRAEREKTAVLPLRGADGEVRTEVRPSSRPLGTLHGTVVVRRLVLVRHGVSGGLRPLDARLNLPDGLYSEGVQREVAWGVAQGSYDTVVENLRRTTGTTIAKRQAEELVVNMTADFQDFYMAQPPQVEPRTHLLVLTFDGSGVVMRPEGLRPETRKKAKKGSRKVSVAESAATGRQRDDERKNRKRMAEVAAVYSLAPASRTPEDVMRELRREGPHVARPRAQNKRVWASLERSILDVVDDGFYEALQRDEANERRWVAVVDGNPDQIAAIERMAHTSEVTVTIVIDFIHVLGYLWKAGKALNGDDAPEVESWVTKRAEDILRGKASLVAAGMRRSATRRGLTGNPRKAVDSCADYLLNHKAYLRYHEYLRDGLPIASGVIEGACRSLVQDRMDITGARWGLPGGEGVLKLRSLRASGDLDDYLAFHARRELDRNHLRNYHEDELVELREAA